MTRGIRNCNPLNIRRVAGTSWRGEDRNPAVPDKQFVQFRSMEWGLRAAFCLLRTYQKKYNATCIQDLIYRWAPPRENNTPAYVRRVCLLTGFGGQERLTEKEWPRLVHAMAVIESTAWLDEELIDRSFKLYKQLNP
jgi:hypothetical protein